MQLELIIKPLARRRVDGENPTKDQHAASLRQADNRWLDDELKLLIKPTSRNPPRFRSLSDLVVRGSSGEEIVDSAAARERPLPAPTLGPRWLRVQRASQQRADRF